MRGTILIALMSSVIVGLIVYFICMVNKEAESRNERSIEAGLVEVHTVGECQYVFWYNGYGSYMEHYEGCSNPKHCN